MKPVAPRQAQSQEVRPETKRERSRARFFSSLLIRRYRPPIAAAIGAVLFRHGRKSDHAALEDLIESVWLRIMKNDCKNLKDWDSQGPVTLAAFLATIGMREALTWC